MNQRELLSFGRDTHRETTRDEAKRGKNVGVARPVYRGRTDNEILEPRLLYDPLGSELRSSVGADGRRLISLVDRPSARRARRGKARTENEQRVGSRFLHRGDDVARAFDVHCDVGRVVGS